LTWGTTAKTKIELTPASFREKDRETACMTREQKPVPGRPPKLDDALACEIASRLIAGHTTVDVAQTLGVSRRSIAGWRARAWSARPEDRVCVELERMIWRGRVAAAEGAQLRVDAAATLPSLDELYANLSDVDWLDD
jgi:hypothetical protein